MRKKVSRTDQLIDQQMVRMDIGTKKTSWTPPCLSLAPSQLPTQAPQNQLPGKVGWQNEPETLVA
jgi:hypothetical protein